ncbi:hypothetical protein OA848_05595 [Rickettsiales bacterium]|nr:hypothetical protein [Rickettsiales bacterium]
MKFSSKIFFVIFSLVFSGCNSDQNYFPLKEKSILNYNLLFITDGIKDEVSKQTYTVIKKDKQKTIVLGNSGQIISYKYDSDGIKRESIDYTKNEYIINLGGKIKKIRNFDLPYENLDYEKGHYVIKFPIEVGTSWLVNDKTRLKMTIGYDKVFETWIPFKLKNKIISVNESVRINNKIFNNCIKVVGKGNTSYNAGPPLGDINIVIENTDWYAPGVGLVKTVRSEKSDSETMGNILTIRTYE